MGIAELLLEQWRHIPSELLLWLDYSFFGHLLLTLACILTVVKADSL